MDEDSTSLSPAIDYDSRTLNVSKVRYTYRDNNIPDDNYCIHYALMWLYEEY